MLDWSERGEERHRRENESEHGRPPAPIGERQARVAPVDEHCGNHRERQRRVAEKQRLLGEIGGMEVEQPPDRLPPVEAAEQRIPR